MAVEKVSVSLDKNLLAEARARTNGHTSLSAYLNDALRRKLKNERLNEYLDELDVEFGPVPPEEQQAAAEWWAGVKTRLDPDGE